MLTRPTNNHLRLAPTPTQDSTPRWDALADPEVQRVVAQAARKVSRTFNIDADDMRQEASIRVATQPDLIECLQDAGTLTYGTFQYRLERDLVDIARSEITKRDRNTSIEVRHGTLGGDDERAPASVALAVRPDTADYTGELVERLLPAVWDDAYYWGLRVENAPDIDMPRGTTNKATGGTLAAHIADIKTAWTCSTLTLGQRQALFLCLGLDWTQVDASVVLGVTQTAVRKRLLAGLTALATTLNGCATKVVRLSQGSVISGGSHSDITYEGLHAVA